MPFTVRHAQPGDAAALVALAEAVGSEPEGWLISESRWPARLMVAFVVLWIPQSIYERWDELGNWAPPSAATTPLDEARLLAPVPRPRQSPGRLTGQWWRWMLAAAVLTGFGFGVLYAGESAGDLGSEQEPTLIGGVLWAGWLLSLHAAVITAAIGAVLAAMHLLVSHHTRHV